MCHLMLIITHANPVNNGNKANNSANNNKLHPQYHHYQHATILILIPILMYYNALN